MKKMESIKQVGNKNPHIIGLTGSFGSGCSYISTEILLQEGYKIFSLSKQLKEIFRSETKKDPNTVPRQELQEFGDNTRKSKGADFFAKMVWEEIEKDNKTKKFVVDSIRNPAESAFFHENTNKFFLFGIYADEEERWARVKDKSIYHGDQSLFIKDDKNDKGKNNPKYGQRVEDCFYEADIVISNNNSFAVPGNEEFSKFKKKFMQYVNLVSEPLRRQIPFKTEESLMAAAYAISQKSSCMKRKVGAVLVDEFGNIISSGYNEVPFYENSCESEFKSCFREKTREEYFAFLDSELEDTSLNGKLKEKFKETFKILDYCRALHAEENTIVNLARNGCSVSLEKSTLYSTTYPCRMCANKIVQANIKRIVYLEPYPDKKGKVILEQAGVKAEAFEGATFKAYFRVYGEQR